MPFESLQQLLLWSPPPVKQYVGAHILIGESKLCIFGAPKSFKSLIAQQLAFSIATGTDWLGFPTIQGRVMYLQCEISKPSFRQRVLQMSSQYKVAGANKPLWFDTNLTFKLDRQSDADYVDSQIRVLKPDILILDPWYKMLLTEDNHSYSRTQDFMDSLISKYKISIIMIHHDTVPMTDQTGAVIQRFHPRGPRTVEGWFDSIIMVDGDITTDDRILKFEMRHAHSLLAPVKTKLDRNTLTMRRV